MNKATDLPLRVRLEGKELVMRIGTETLKFAAEYLEEFYDHEKHHGPPYVKVANKRTLANDVIEELNREDEVGNSLLTKMLDKAIVAARENGSLGFVDED